MNCSECERLEAMRYECILRMARLSPTINFCRIHSSFARRVCDGNRDLRRLMDDQEI